MAYGVELQTGVTINSKASLESAFEMQTGFNFQHKETYAASQSIGATIVLPPHTRTVLKVYPIEMCYAFREQYYVLGIPVGSSNLVGGFSPVGAKYRISQRKTMIKAVFSLAFEEGGEKEK